ncbi:c-type cytochrome domain-containing protein [Rubinisphaera italica]|uniref:Cytochrome C Planctomycete-type domain-containing protein n=1 Tax=Rubinisphaera italica TaxID=2527969 RepID=A0A5C5XDP2_9PLAN|nr:c-type cytochrome domain-containing protein [Rubinisphaera italica]TWT60928.1 hypothetical protein Pan54_16600 [Rubinisphaera italica]
MKMAASGFVCLLLCMVVPVRAADADKQAAASKKGFDKVVKPFLNDYCESCHGENEPEGDVNLSRLSSGFTDSRDAEKWPRVLAQLELGTMPPEEEPQPSDKVNQEVVGWIKSEISRSGRGAAYQQKIQMPHYGNYVDHEKLFSGEIQEDAGSPERLWRRSPEHFDIAKRTYFGVHKNPAQTIGEVDKLKQPFNKGSAEGVSDYASLFYADSATFDTLYRNAAFVVVRTLLMAFIEYDYKSRGKTLGDWKADRAKVLQSQQEEIERYKKEGKTTRYISAAHRALNAKYNLQTPEVYRDIILGEGNPRRLKLFLDCFQISIQETVSHTVIDMHRL